MRYGPPPGFDDFGQVDGDESASVQFQGTGGGQPWLREGIPPWHMWGNSILLDPVPLGNEDLDVPETTGQLIKISYKRPETWHWILSARIVRAPGRPLIPVSSVVVTVIFDLIVGVGRSNIQMRNFETFQWAWVGEQEVPTEHVMWSSSGLTPALAYTPLPDPEPDLTTRRTVDQLSAQDIQVSCRVSMLSEDGIGDPGAIEVSAVFAPKTHVRPDWFVDGPPELMFPGAETQGK